MRQAQRLAVVLGLNVALVIGLAVAGISIGSLSLLAALLRLSASVHAWVR